MTSKSCAEEAAATISAKAMRLAVAAANVKRGQDEFQRQADALHRIANAVAAAAEIPGGLQASSLPDVTANDRRIAGVEIWSLALRRQSRGEISELGVAVPHGWDVGCGDFGTPIHRPTLFEAVELFEIACALHAEEYWIYSKGLLLMTMGEYQSALQVFEKITGSYENISQQMADRCRRELANSYDKRAEMATAFDKQIARFRQRGVDASHIEYAKEHLFGALAAADSTPPSARTKVVPPGRGEIEQSERAASVAQQFAEHLAYGNFDAAQALLARNLATIDAGQLRQTYTRMTCLDDSEDPGQIEICVVSASRRTPQMKPADLAHVYVAISAFMFNEAVSVTVTLEDGDAKIREIEWGRP